MRKVHVIAALASDRFGELLAEDCNAAKRNNRNIVRRGAKSQSSGWILKSHIRRAGHVYCSGIGSERNTWRQLKHDVGDRRIGRRDIPGVSSQRHCRKLQRHGLGRGIVNTIRPDERGSVISILQGGTPTAFSPLLRPLVVVLARSAKARIKSNYA